jgi:hypothetical protein
MPPLTTVPHHLRVEETAPRAKADLGRESRWKRGHPHLTRRAQSLEELVREVDEPTCRAPVGLLGERLLGGAPPLERSASNLLGEAQSGRNSRPQHQPCCTKVRIATAMPSLQLCRAAARSVLGEGVVRIAVQPALAGLGRGDHRVTPGAGVLAGVPVRRTVAAARAAALVTGSEVYPAGADADALLALAPIGVLHGFDRLEVGAGRTGIIFFLGGLSSPSCEAIVVGSRLDYTARQ